MAFLSPALLACLLGVPVLWAMDGPSPAGRPLDRIIAGWEAERRKGRDQIQEARARLEQAERALESAAGAAGKARAEADVLMAGALLLEREAEAHMAECDQFRERWQLHRERQMDRRGLRGLALTQLCLERSGLAAARAVTALREARVLAAQAKARKAVALAMERTALWSASLGLAPPEASLALERAALAACAAVLAPMEQAGATPGVGPEFLEAQEAEMERLCAEFSGTG